MRILKSVIDFIDGPSKISRLGFIWRMIFFGVCIPESLNLLFGDLTSTFGSQPIWIMLLICMALLVSVVGNFCAVAGRLNDLGMSGYWFLLILFPPLLFLLWIYLALKPAPIVVNHALDISFANRNS